MPGSKSTPWWEDVHGDPCRQCGTSWVVPFDHAVEDVRDVPRRLAALVTGLPPDARCPELSWSAVEYAVHIADSLRMWAERGAGALAGDPHCAFGQDLAALADVRRYDRFGWGAALWSVRRSADEWCEVVEELHQRAVAVSHPNRGCLSAEDVALRGRHSVLHHVWDVKRIVATATGGA